MVIVPFAVLPLKLPVKPVAAAVRVATVPLSVGAVLVTVVPLPATKVVAL